MKKEKHPFYWLILAALILLLALGVALLIMGASLGPNRVFTTPPVSL